MKVLYLLLTVGIIYADYGQVALGRRLGENMAPIENDARELIDDTRKLGRRPPRSAPEEFRFKWLSENPQYPNHVLVPKEPGDVLPIPPSVNALFVEGCESFSCKHASWYWIGKTLRSANDPTRAWCLAVDFTQEPSMNLMVRPCVLDQYEKWKYDEQEQRLCCNAFLPRIWCVTVAPGIIVQKKGKDFNAVVTEWAVDNVYQKLEKIPWPPD